MMMNVDVVVYVNWLPTLIDPASQRGARAVALDTALRAEISAESSQCLGRLDTEQAGGHRIFDGGVYAGAFAQLMPAEIVDFLDHVDWRGSLGLLVMRVHGHGAVTIAYPRPESEASVPDIRSKQDAPATRVPSDAWKKEDSWQPPV